MMHKTRTIVLMLAALVVGASVQAQVTVSDLSRSLTAIPLIEGERIVAAFAIGFTQEVFPAEQVLRFIDRLTSAPGNPAEKERLLMVLARAMEDGLPIDELVNQGFEGLARSIPLPDIERRLSQRLILLIEVRDLLYAVGVFSASPGAPAVPSALPSARFHPLVMHIADAVGDYLDGGGSPLEGHAIYQEVLLRLTTLQGVTLPMEDVQLVLDRIEPSELARVALSAVS